MPGGLLVQAGEVEAIVSNASGCGAMLKDWGHVLRHEPAYAEKAARISALTKDLSELLPALLPGAGRQAARPGAGRPPTHGLPPAMHAAARAKLKGVVEGDLAKLGFQLTTARTESHLCCGSAGTYSVLQPVISKTLRDRKLKALDDAVAAPAGHFVGQYWLHCAFAKWHRCARAPLGGSAG